MFRRSMVLLCALFLVVPLTGCETLVRMFGKAPDQMPEPGCTPLYTAGGAGFTFKGFSLPLGGNKNFKIGEAEWTPVQASKFENSILALEEQRQEQCTFLHAMKTATPPASASQVFEAFKLRMAMLDRVETLKIALASNAPPDQVVSQAAAIVVEAKTTTTKAVQALKPLVADPPASAPSSPSAMLDAALIRVATLESSVADLQGKLAKVTIASSRPATKTVTIDGFATGAVVADAAKRDAALVELESVVNRFPAEQVPSMSIVGYADSEGAYAINVRLGLQRAKAVADLVSKSFAGRANIRSVTSGGVLDDRADARRVEIVVSTRLMTSPRDQA